MIDDILAELEADTSLEVGEQFAAVTARYFESTRAGKGQVSTPRSAEELAKRFDEEFPRDGRPVTEIIERLEREVLADANKYYHPMYMGHQTSAPLPVGVWMESVIGALNQSLAVQEMSPTATMIEHQIVGWLAKLAGYGAGAGGTMTSGGTEANFTAMLAARNAAVPNAWEDGLGADPPVVVYGEHAHYAVTRAIGQLGMGRRRGISIASRNHRIDVDLLFGALDRLREEGKRVMAVVATAGTTATGSFDDLEAVGALCEERGIWLHVDGAHGASALLSSRPPRALNGLRHSRSLAWDPHKMMLLPLAAGMVLTRNEGDLERAFAQQAPYLFHAGKSIRGFEASSARAARTSSSCGSSCSASGPADSAGCTITCAAPLDSSMRRSKSDQISRICTNRSRTFSASGIWAATRRSADRAPPRVSTSSIASFDRATTKREPVGLPRRFSMAGRCCG
jgi:L-2,4-diaminobutyrate decarboxylase